MKIAEMCAEQINPADAKSRAADLWVTDNCYENQDIKRLKM